MCLSVNPPQEKLTTPFATGFILLLSLGLLLVVGVPMQYFGLAVTPFHFPVSFLLSVSLAICFTDYKTLLKSVLYSVLIIALAIWIASRTYDPNFDAEWYHYEMVDFFAEGTWNPYLHPTDGPEINVFATHYPHAVEFCEACIYSFTGCFQDLKAFSLILMSATGFLVWVFSEELQLSKKRPVLSRLAFLLIVMANPVGLAQAPTASVDYILYYSLVIMIISSLGIYRQQNTWVNYILLVTVIVLGVNTKSTIFVMQVIAVAAIIAGWLIFGRKDGLKRYVAVTLIAGILAIVVWGFHPYITNMIYHGNPVYPHDNESYQELVNYGPDIVRGHNRFAKFFISVYEPFPQVSQWSQQWIGGFGIIFRILLPFSVIILLYHIFSNRRIDIISYAMILTVLSCFIFGATWWVRFICQLWLIVPCAFIIVCKTPAIWAKIAGWTLGLLVVVNSVFIFRINYRECLNETVYRDAIYQVLANKTVKIAYLSKHEQRELEKFNIAVENVPFDSIPEENIMGIPTYQWEWMFNIMDIDAVQRKEIDARKDSMLNLPPQERLKYLITR